VSRPSDETLGECRLPARRIENLLNGNLRVERTGSQLGDRTGVGHIDGSTCGSVLSTQEGVASLCVLQEALTLHPEWKVSRDLARHDGRPFLRVDRPGSPEKTIWVVPTSWRPHYSMPVTDPSAAARLIADQPIAGFEEAP
jgi:hypothetical protein